MSACISLTLEASEMFKLLVPPYDLQSRKSCCYLGSSLEMIAPRFLKFSTSSSLWHFILISLRKPFGLFVITFVLSGPISILYLVLVLSRRSSRTPASFFSSAFATMSSAKRKLVISRPPMLTLPSWPPNASHMILSGKMLKQARCSCELHLWTCVYIVWTKDKCSTFNQIRIWKWIKV